MVSSMVKAIKATDFNQLLEQWVVNPYYGNSLYSGLAGNTHQPLQQINWNNKHASKKNRDRIGSLHDYINIMVQMVVYTFSIPFLCSLQSAW